MTQSELKNACEQLVTISQWPPEEDCCYPFDFKGARPATRSSLVVPRCVSPQEARAKLRAVERLTRQPVGALLIQGWDQLSPAQLVGVEDAVLTVGTGPRSHDHQAHAPLWCRLDAQLYHLAFWSWIHGPNFAPAPRPRALAKQLGVDLDGYQEALQGLRAALTRPANATTRWPARVDLWLGDPPPGEAGLPMPRLWASGRELELAAAAAAQGLLPANTAAQEREARQELGRRWSLRRDEADPVDLDATPWLPPLPGHCSRPCGARTQRSSARGV